MKTGGKLKMQKYFNLLKQVANSDPREFDSIGELTKEIATKAGYRREWVTFKNGSKRLKTVYGQLDENGNRVISWDEALVSKWLLYYESYIKFKTKSFVGRMREAIPEIIQEIFVVTFNALQLEKFDTDQKINSFIKMSITCRVGDYLRRLGSSSRFSKTTEKTTLDRLYKQNKISKEEYEESLKNADKVSSSNSNLLRFNNAINEQACSINYIEQEYGNPLEDVEAQYGFDDTYTWLHSLVGKNNDAARDLINGIMSCESTERLSSNNIFDYISSKIWESDVHKNKYINDLVDAWETIAETISMQYDKDLPDDYKLDATKLHELFTQDQFVRSTAMEYDLTPNQTSTLQKYFSQISKSQKSRCMALCMRKALELHNQSKGACENDIFAEQQLQC
jgi:hypothetical protein